jgi:RecA-family ATPase
VLEDNDEAGRKRTDKIGRLLLDVGARVRVLRIADYWADCPKGGDVSDWKEQAGGCPDQLFEILDRLNDWQPPPAGDQPGNGGSGDANNGDPGWAPGPEHEPEQPPAPFVTVSAADWADRRVPARRWLVHERLARGNVGILSGNGGVGKPTAALQLAVGVVRGFAWLNAVVEEAAPVLFFSAEEDEHEVWRRLQLIAKHHDLGLADLRDLHVHCRPEQDALLAVPDRGVIKPTPLLAQLTEAVSDLRAALVIVEAAADVFGGDEIARAQVRQFLALLRRMARATDASVLLLQHPSQAGLDKGTGTAGSLHWRNTARPFLYLSKADEDDVRKLKVEKNNYAAEGETVSVRWRNGIFTPIGIGSTIERAAAAAVVDQTFLSCVDLANAQKRHISPNKGSTYAPVVIANMPEAAGLRKEALVSAMERTIADGRVLSKERGPPSKRRVQLIRAGGVAA